ncbi:unnamed protein product, partial [Prorocentrum cordatum]
PVGASLQSMEARLQASLQTAVATASASMSQVFQDTVIDLAKQNDARFQAMEDRIAPVGARMNDLDRLQKDIQMLMDGLVVLNSGVSVPQTGGNLDRDLDPAVATVFAKTALASRFLRRCKGAATLAERRASTLLQLIRLGKRQWREVHALAPTGVQVNLNLGKGRNRRQVSHELALKKIRQGIERMLPRELFMKKDAAALSPQWAQLLRVEIASPTARPEIIWNAACIREFDLNKDELAEAAAQVLQPEAQEGVSLTAWRAAGAARRVAPLGRRSSLPGMPGPSRVTPPKIVKRKLPCLQTHWRGPVVLGMQETRAGVEATQQLLGARADAGGAAAFFPAQTSGERVVSVPPHAIPGRALRVMASLPGAELRRWNVRNFGFAAEMRHWHQGLRLASGIGKALVSEPRRAQCKQRRDASVRGEPRELQANGPAPIPGKLVKPPRYREIVACYCEEVRQEHLAPPDAYAACVATLQTAAKLLQADLLLATDGGAKGANAMIWRQLARALWRQGAKLARVAMAQNAWACEGQSERAVLKGHAEFERRFLLAQRREAAARMREAQPEAEVESAAELRKLMLAQARALRRRPQLRAPRGARQRLAAQGTVAALAAHRALVFAPPRGPAVERRRAQMQEKYLMRFATPEPEWD